VSWLLAPHGRTDLLRRAPGCTGVQGHAIPALVGSGDHPYWTAGYVLLATVASLRWVAVTTLAFERSHGHQQRDSA
jgi:hypothetical protein